jgi:WD40 repeat protein
MPLMNMLDLTTRKLEKNPQIDRIKKLMFCACHGRWSKDAQAMSGKELQQCLQVLCDLHPSIVEFKHALYQIVIRLNHSSDYYAIANTLCEAVEPYYALSAPPTVTADAASTQPLEPEAIPSVSTTAGSLANRRPRAIHFKIQAPSLQQARMICEISLEGRKQAQTTLNLPLQLVRDYASWQTAYRKLDPRPSRLPVGKSLDPAPEQINLCLDATTELVSKFQRWYHSPEWQPVQEQIQRLVPIEAPVTITVSSDLLSLLKLPWNVCFQPLLAAYPHAETIIQLDVSLPPRQVQVVSIIASGMGIDSEKSQFYLDGLPNTRSQIYVESTVDRIWAALNENVSVVAISSYRSGYATHDKVYINHNDTIDVAALQQVLRPAVERGLKLLLWNGGDGLEMANILAETGVPYLVVTREPLSDRVANELLKLVLKFLAEGKTLPAAVRSARERLQEIERVFPAASWLPLLCQSGAVERDLVWADLAMPVHVPRLESASVPLAKDLPVTQAEVIPSGVVESKVTTVAENQESIRQPVIAEDRVSVQPVEPVVAVQSSIPQPAPMKTENSVVQPVGIASIEVIKPEVKPLAQPVPPASISIPIDYDTLSLDRCLTGYYSEVHSLAISADRKLIISGHGDIGQKDNNVKIWLLDSGELVQDLTGHRDAVESLVALSNPQQFRSVGADGRLLDWDIATGRVTPIGPEIKGGLNAVLTMNNGTQTIGGSSKGTIYIWEASGRTLRSWTAGSSVRGLGIDRSEKVLVSGSDDGVVSLWEVATGRLLHQLHGHSGAVQSVAMSPTGDRAVSAGVDRTIRVWDVATGEQLHILVGHERPVNCVAITPDGRSIVSGSDDKTIKIWNLADGWLVNNLFGHGSPVLALAIAPDGTMLVTGGYGEIRIWEIE